MVYKSIKIVLGIAVSNKIVKTLAERDENEWINTMGTLKCKKNVNIYQLPGHNSKKFIIGISLHKYFRKHVPNCEECDEYIMCDTCIGQTNNGFYDVITMIEEPIEVNIRNICFHCFSDHTDDLGAPLENILPADYMSERNSDRLQECSTCGLKPDFRFCPKTALNRNHYFDQLSKFFQDYDELMNKKIKFYYLVDDCLCCGN